MSHVHERTAVTVAYAALVLLAAAGCARGSAADGGSGDVSEAAWRLSAEPELRLGEGDGASSLFRVMGAVRLDDGRVAVANGGSQQVRIFGPDGAWLADLGRAGGGPGEFEVPAWVGVHHDTLIVWDLLARRISRFDPDGRFVRSATVDEAAGHFPRMVGMYPDGTLLLASDAASARGGTGVIRDSTAVLRVSGEGRILDTLAVLPASEQFASVSGDGRRFKLEELPFGRRTVTALHGDALFVGTGDGEVRAVDPQGRPVSRFAVPGSPVSVRASDVDEYWSKLVTTGRGADAGDREPTPGIPYPTHLPPHGPLHIDAAGRLWIANAVLPRQWDEPMAWKVFTPSGEPVGSIRLPARSLVLQVGADWILLREMDADQREVVSLYRFTIDD